MPDCGSPGDREDVVDRDLDWDGCFNVRDLGGFRTECGQSTRWGAIVRSDGRERLTPSGWEALERYGIRTIVDLRDRSQLSGAALPRQVTLIHVPVLDLSNRFWEKRHGRAIRPPYIERGSTTGPTGSRRRLRRLPRQNRAASLSSANPVETEPAWWLHWCSGLSASQESRLLPITP
jgi:protein-tyrosine phosphatase family protein